MIKVCADLESLSTFAARLVAEEARRAVREKGSFALSLAGGGTPRRTYELLAQPPFRDEFRWERTHVFWGDERCVAATDPRNNARMAREALLDHVPIPPDHIHAMICEQSPADSARKYESLLRQFFGGGPPRFDLILLGLGEDGHTASLFPGSPVLWEQQRWVAEVPATEQGLHRLTLTAQVINQAVLVVFLVSGSSKAWALREVLEETPQPSHHVPARLIRPVGRLLWLVDREAAKGLQALQREAK